MPASFCRLLGQPANPEWTLPFNALLSLPWPAPAGRGEAASHSPQPRGFVPPVSPAVSPPVSPRSARVPQAPVLPAGSTGCVFSPPSSSQLSAPPAGRAAAAGGQDCTLGQGHPPFDHPCLWDVLGKLSDTRKGREEPCLARNPPEGGRANAAPPKAQPAPVLGIFASPARQPPGHKGKSSDISALEFFNLALPWLRCFALPSPPWSAHPADKRFAALPSHLQAPAVQGSCFTSQAWGLSLSSAE